MLNIYEIYSDDKLALIDELIESLIDADIAEAFKDDEYRAYIYCDLESIVSLLEYYRFDLHNATYKTLNKFISELFYYNDFNLEVIGCDLVITYPI